jgi:hypothetical protein
LVASVASAQARQKSIAEELSGEARASFEQGKELFEHEDYVTSHAKLERAYELSTNPRILWNMAACSAKQKKYALAIAEADRYLLEGSGKLTPEQVDRAQTFVRDLRGYVAEATFRVTPAGARLSIDRVPRGLLNVPTEVLLDLGAHTVQLEKEGYETVRTAIDVTKVGKAEYAFTLSEVVRTGRVAVSTDMDALIELDGRPVGKGLHEASLPVGPHRLRITAADREAHDRVVEIAEGATMQVTVTLVAKKQESSAWWPWVLGGAVVAVGAGVGGYFLFKPSDEVGQPIAGTIDTIRINN